MDDQHWMALAIDEAKKAPRHGDVPVGCVIVLEDKLIARAHNERELLHDPTAHAEILALRRAGEALQRSRLDGALLYVTHEPCPMCAGALIMARIHRVVYGCSEPQSGTCGTLMNLVQFPGFTHNVRITGPICQETCVALTRSFFMEKRE